MVEENGKLFAVIIIPEFGILAGLFFDDLEGRVDGVANLLAEALVIFVETFFFNDEFLQLFIKGGEEICHFCRCLCVGILVFPEESRLKGRDDFSCYSKCTFLFFFFWGHTFGSYNIQ